MSAPLSDREFEQFRKLIHDVAGIHLSDAKRQLVSSRLAKRIRQREATSYGDYFSSLTRDATELQMAVDLLTTNETYFFREPRHFDFLRDAILPELSGTGPIRVWSGACSSGEEAYTIAMVLAEHAGARGWEVFASDISSRVLEKARAAIYPMTDTEDIPKHYLHKYCLKGVGEHAGRFALEPSLRQRVRFEQVNLNAALPAIGIFDVIFLRNVMIYFNAETKRSVVQRMLPLLRPGGWFIVSHSESLNGITDALQLVKPSIYRKLDQRATP